MNVTTEDARNLAIEIENLSPTAAAPRPEDITPVEAVRLFVEANKVRAIPRKASEYLRYFASQRDLQKEIISDFVLFLKDESCRHGKTGNGCVRVVAGHIEIIPWCDGTMYAVWKNQRKDTK